MAQRRREYNYEDPENDWAFGFGYPSQSRSGGVSFNDPETEPWEELRARRAQEALATRRQGESIDLPLPASPFGPRELDFTQPEARVNIPLPMPEPRRTVGQGIPFDPQYPSAGPTRENAASLFSNPRPSSGASVPNINASAPRNVSPDLAQPNPNIRPQAVRSVQRGIPSGIPMGIPEGGSLTPPNGRPRVSRMENPMFGGPTSVGTNINPANYGDFGASRMVQNATPQDVSSRPRTPAYDYGPMNRYNRYLTDEPDRTQIRPGRFATAINALSAGMESMDRGVGAGVKMYQDLRDRPYQEAYESWQNRGKRYESEVRAAEARYKNQVEAFNKQADNECADRLADLTERGVAVREANQLLAAEKALSEGWTPGIKNGKVVFTKITSEGMATRETDLEPDRLTALQQIDRDAANRRAALQRTQIGANTSVANTRAVINAQAARATEAERGRNTRATEAERGRQSRFETEQNNPTTTVAERQANRPVVPGVASSMDTPKRVLQAFPIFDDTRFGGVAGNEYVPKPMKQENLDAYLADIAKKNKLPIEQVEQQWEEFQGSMIPFFRRVR